MTNPLDRVRKVIDDRDRAGLRRTLRPRRARDDLLDLASNDYLGLARDPRVTAAAAAAAQQWGAGSTGSRLVTGSTDLHADLERELAAFTQAAGALVFSSGYLANLGAVTALGGPDVTVVSDMANHASLIDACRLSRSTITVAPHRDIDKVDAALTTADTAHKLVVTDAVFSVDGDLAPLAELHAVTRRHGAILIVDEAHSLGVVGDGGRGAVVAAGIADAPDVVRTVTLSKSLASQGGAVVGAPEIIELLVNTARPFIFDTGLTPASAGSALEALRIVADEPSLAATARSNALRVAAIVADLGVETSEPSAAVVPAFLGDPRRALDAAERCLELGIRVGCFRPPSVPPGRACLRLTARADLTGNDLDRVAEVLEKVLR